MKASDPLGDIEKELPDVSGSLNHPSDETKRKFPDSIKKYFCNGPSPER